MLSGCSEDYTVYIGDNGNYYHFSINCGNLENPSMITLYEAKNRGYSACPVCSMGRGTSTVYTVMYDGVGVYSIDGTVLATLSAYTKIDVYGIEDGSARIIYNGEIGFLPADYIEPGLHSNPSYIFQSSKSASNQEKNSSASSKAPTKTYYTTAYELNVRDYPSIQGTILTTFPANTEIQVYGFTADGWAQFDYNGGYGYVHGDYITDTVVSTGSQSSSYATDNVITAEVYYGYTPLQSLFFSITSDMSEDQIINLAKSYGLYAYTSKSSTFSSKFVYVSSGDFGEYHRYSDTYEFGSNDFIEVVYDRHPDYIMMKKVNYHFGTYVNGVKYTVENSIGGNAAGNHFFVKHGYISVDPTIVYPSLQSAFDTALALYY